MIVPCLILLAVAHDNQGSSHRLMSMFTVEDNQEHKSLRAWVQSKGWTAVLALSGTEPFLDAQVPLWAKAG